LFDQADLLKAVTSNINWFGTASIDSTQRLTARRRLEKGELQASHRALARRLILIFRPARPAKSPIDNVNLTSLLVLSPISGVMRRERW
jgi:hypothetical protein